MKLLLLLCTLLATINLHVCQRGFIEILTSCDVDKLNREYSKKNEEFLKKHSDKCQTIKVMEFTCNEECIAEANRCFFSASYYDYCMVDCRLRKLKAIIEKDYYQNRSKQKAKKVRFQLEKK